MSRSYEKLDCHQRSAQLAALIISYCGDLKPYRFAEQIAASSISISSNIAEGSQYHSTKDFQRFLTYALGSAAELDSQLYVLSLIHPEDNRIEQWRTELVEIRMMISGLKRSLGNWNN